MTAAPLPSPAPGLEGPLIRWFISNARSYPWRTSRSPFHVLSAEVMLQRTRADQVEGVWTRFAATYDGPIDLLEAGRHAVDELFSSLGLRWRVGQFWALCRELVAEYGGEVPADREALLSLPGVGQYAAGTTLTNAFGKPTGVVDSNILRIYGRYFGIEFTDSDRRKKSVLEWADALVPDDPDEARRYNLALVDLGALVCTPKNPRCLGCPLRDTCRYALENPTDPAGGS